MNGLSFYFPMSFVRTVVLALLSVFFIMGQAFSVQIVNPGGTIPIPVNLRPGDRFHLAFASSGRRDGTSSEIQDYNDFVQGIANTAGIGDSQGVSWFAIVSTAEVNARENVVVSAPVYNMRSHMIDSTQLELVANDADDIWSGSIVSNIGWDEKGEDAIFDTWTGSLPNGLAASVKNGFAVDEFLGSSTSGPRGETAWCGSPFSSTDTWLQIYNPVQTLLLSVYGLSEELLVAEPGLAGDFDDSNLVDLGDLNLVLFNWHQLGVNLPFHWTDQRPGDAENVGVAQLNDVLFNWHQSLNVPVSVPESICVAPLLFGLIPVTVQCLTGKRQLAGNKCRS